MRRRGPWFLVTWLIAAVAALFLYQRWHVRADLIGLVETRSHVLSAQEGGVVRSVLAPVGTRVRKGEAVALFDLSDLVAERIQIQAALTALAEVRIADRQRYALEHDVLALTVAERRGDHATRTATLEARRAEAQALDAEIARLQGAEEAGLGHAEQLGALVIRRKAMGEFVNSLGGDLTGLPDTRGVIAGSEAVLTSKGGDRLTEVLALRDRLVRLRERERRRTVLSPSDGFIVALHARNGDTVPAFSPVATVEETTAEHVEVYLPEARDLNVGVDQRVTVVSKRKSGGRVGGTVSFVHPGYERIPDRLMFGRQLAWARKLRVRLPADHALRPGESVRVRLEGEGGGWAPWGAVSHAAPPNKSAPGDPAPLTPPPPPPPAPPSVPEVSAVDAAKVPDLSPMRLSASLRAKTRFEPSGAVWLADLDRFLVVSDDTGHKGGEDNHAPWVFLSDSAGRVDDEPLRIEGLPSINDLEAVTAMPDGHLVLATSASVNKKGRRPRDRALLLKVARQGRRLRLVASVPLLRRIETAYGIADRRALGLSTLAADGRPLLNIEAMTWHEGGLMFGLKEPVGDGGAALWRLERPDALFSGSPLSPGQLRLAGRVDLGRRHGRGAGLSDLAAAPNGDLLATSTVPHAPDSEQFGAIFRLSRDATGGWGAAEWRRFPGLKPEGLARMGDGRLFVVVDTGAGNPLFALLDPPG